MEATTQTTKEERQQILRDLKQLGATMFHDQPVLITEDFDRVLKQRWEETFKRTADEHDRTATGRNRFMNLVDWVKADFTRTGQTFTLEWTKKEYRLWCGTVGDVRGESLVPLNHLLAVAQEIFVRHR